jgi:hypothetical protein
VGYLAAHPIVAVLITAIFGIAARREAGKLFERSNVGGKVSRLNSRQ